MSQDFDVGLGPTGMSENVHFVGFISSSCENGSSAPKAKIRPGLRRGENGVKSGPATLNSQTKNIRFSTSRYGVTPGPSDGIAANAAAGF